jgi:hypothetical protein
MYNLRNTFEIISFDKLDEIQRAERSNIKFVAEDNDPDIRDILLYYKNLNKWHKNLNMPKYRDSKNSAVDHSTKNSKIVTLDYAANNIDWVRGHDNKHYRNRLEKFTPDKSTFFRLILQTCDGCGESVILDGNHRAYWAYTNKLNIIFEIVEIVDKNIRDAFDINKACKC